MNSKLPFLLLMASTALSLPLQAAVINDVNWSNAYQPDSITNPKYPNDPTGVTGGAWTSGGTGGAASIPGNYLSIKTESVTANHYYSNNDNWTGSTGMTLETSVRVSEAVGANGIIGQIRVGGTSSLSTNKYVYLNFSTTQISYSNAVGIFPILTGLDLTKFTTVRILLSDDLSNGNTDALKIYLNDNYVASISGNAFSTAAGTNNVVFGDVNMQIAGKSDWNYIAYTQGQWAPIPEPSSMALLGFIGVAGILIQRKKRLNA